MESKTIQSTIPVETMAATVDEVLSKSTVKRGVNAVTSKLA